MTQLEGLKLAVTLMAVVNDRHKADAFQEPGINKADQTLSFDLHPAYMEEALAICTITGLSLHPVAMSFHVTWEMR